MMVGGPCDGQWINMPDDHRSRWWVPVASRLTIPLPEEVPITPSVSAVAYERGVNRCGEVVYHYVW